jgi:hypothetical protein
MKYSLDGPLKSLGLCKCLIPKREIAVPSRMNQAISHIRKARMYAIASRPITVEMLYCMMSDSDLSQTDPRSTADFCRIAPVAVLTLALSQCLPGVDHRRRVGSRGTDLVLEDRDAKAKMRVRRTPMRD